MLRHIKIICLETSQCRHIFTPSNLCDVCLTLLKALFLKNANVRSNILSKKISHLSVVFGGMVIFWFWGSQLKSYFALPLKTLPFHNLEEFVTKSNKKVTVILKIVTYIQRS